MEKNAFNQHIRPALTCLALFTILFGIAYPAGIFLINQILYKEKADGSLIFKKDEVIGSKLIGQPFLSARYFWSRPSATDYPYNAAASAGANWGSANPELLDNIRKRIDQLHALAPKNKKQIPVDLLAASASGLDPHISLAAALYQAPRVAISRKIPEDQVVTLIQKHTEKRQWGFLGEPCVNVLQLNLDLDAL